MIKFSKLNNLKNLWNSEKFLNILSVQVIFLKLFKKILK